MIVQFHALEINFHGKLKMRVISSHDVIPLKLKRSPKECKLIHVARANSYKLKRLASEWQHASDIHSSKCSSRYIVVSKPVSQTVWVEFCGEQEVPLNLILLRLLEFARHRHTFGNKIIVRRRYRFSLKRIELQSEE